MGNYEMNSPKPPPGTTAKPNYTLYGDSEELNRKITALYSFTTCVKQRRKRDIRYCLFSNLDISVFR